MPTNMGGWYIGINEDRKVRRVWSVGSTGDNGSGKGRLHMIFYCVTKEETEGLGLGE